MNLIQLFLKTKFGHTLFLLYLTRVSARRIAKLNSNQAKVKSKQNINDLSNESLRNNERKV